VHFRTAFCFTKKDQTTSTSCTSFAFIKLSHPSEFRLLNFVEKSQSSPTEKWLLTECYQHICGNINFSLHWLLIQRSVTANDLNVTDSTKSQRFGIVDGSKNTCTFCEMFVFLFFNPCIESPLHRLRLIWKAIDLFCATQQISYEFSSSFYFRFSRITSTALEPIEQK